MPGPFYDFSPIHGFHVLKDEWKQVKYMADQCQWLTKELELAINATHRLAPNRSDLGFKLEQRVTQDRPENGEERQLEWDIYKRWGLTGSSEDAEHGLFRRVVGFQVPLYDNIGRDGWGEMDHVLISSDGNPGVVELKTGQARDMPLRVLLEAAAYAIALKKNWPAFYGELSNLLGNTSTRLQVNELPEVFSLSLLAPEQFWCRLKNTPQIDDSRWQSFRLLMNGLKEQGFPTLIGSIAQNGDIQVIDL